MRPASWETARSGPLSAGRPRGAFFEREPLNGAGCKPGSDLVPVPRLVVSRDVRPTNPRGAPCPTFAPDSPPVVCSPRSRWPRVRRRPPPTRRRRRRPRRTTTCSPRGWPAARAGRPTTRRCSCCCPSGRSPLPTPGRRWCGTSTATRPPTRRSSSAGWSTRAAPGAGRPTGGTRRSRPSTCPCPDPARRGCSGVDLKSQPIELGDGIYKVTVIVTLNPIDVAGNPFSTGYLHKFAAQPANDAWLPTMLDLCDGIDRNPTDAAPHQRRRRMLADADVFSTFTPPTAGAAGRVGRRPGRARPRRGAGRQRPGCAAEPARPGSSGEMSRRGAWATWSGADPVGLFTSSPPHLFRHNPRQHFLTPMPGPINLPLTACGATPGATVLMFKIADGVFEFFASLKLAIGVIASLAVYLAVGTMYESRYGSQAARAVVYEAPAFLLIMSVLAINVLAAVPDPVPLEAEANGIHHHPRGDRDSPGRLPAELPRLHRRSPDHAARRRGARHRPHRRTTGRQPAKQIGERPGGRAGRAVATGRLPGRVAVHVGSGRGAVPAPKWTPGTAVATDLDDGARLEVLDWLPAAKLERKYLPDPAGATGGRGPPDRRDADGHAGRRAPLWLHPVDGGHESADGNGAVGELFNGVIDAALWPARSPAEADAFLKPPAADAVPEHGAIDLLLDGSAPRVNIDDALAKPVALAGGVDGARRRVLPAGDGEERQAGQGRRRAERPGRSAAPDGTDGRRARVRAVGELPVPQHLFRRHRPTGGGADAAVPTPDRAEDPARAGPPRPAATAPDAGRPTAGPPVWVARARGGVPGRGRHDLPRVDGVEDLGRISAAWPTPGWTSRTAG